MLRTFGILAPRSQRLEIWQRATVLAMVATGLARPVSWRTSPYPDGVAENDLVACDDLVHSSEDLDPDFWLSFCSTRDEMPPGEVWRFEGCPFRGYAGEGWLQEVILHDGVRVLHHARIRVHPELATTCRRWFAVASALPARALVQWDSMGPGSFEPRIAPFSAPPPGAAKLMLRRLTRFLRDKMDDLFVHDIWNVGVTEITWKDGRLVLGSPRWMPPRPELRYVADPFPLNDHEYLIEDYGYGRSSKGRIGRIGPSGLETVIEEPFHLSYPALLREGDELFCIPESHQDRSCRLYRIVGDQWRFEGKILDGIEAIDPTLFHHGGRWWLFCSDTEDGGFCRLKAFHAPSFHGPWSPHALNPLKRDLRGARPAGPIFRQEGILMRSGQDCTRTYGGGVVLFRIDELTPTTFRETEVQHLLPFDESPYPDGLHHLVIEPHRAVLDGKRRTVDPLFWLKRLLRKS